MVESYEDLMDNVGLEELEDQALIGTYEHKLSSK